MSAFNGFVDFTIEFTRIVPPILLVCGVLGNVLSLMAFSGGILRQNPCATYFFGLAITHINNLVFGLLLNNLGDAYGINVLTWTEGFCRFRFYVLHPSVVLSSWFLVLASIDRFCISSVDVNRRRFSSTKNARILVGLAVLTCLILYVHILIFFTIQQTPLGPQCNPQPGAYAVFYGFFFLITYSLTPPILMIIIGLATFYKTRQLYRQINPLREENLPQTTTTTNNANRLRKKDRQFIKMLLIQLISCVIFTLPLAVQKLYSTFTEYTPKSSERLFIENFFTEFVRTLTQINSTLSFYLYTFSSSVFRRQLCLVFARIIKPFFGTNNRLHRQLNQTTVPAITTHGTSIQRKTNFGKQTRPGGESEQ